MDPLRIPTIEAKPKKLTKIRSFRDTIGLSKFPMQQQAFTEIVACIQSGKPIPAAYYRKDRDTTDDQLLREHGIIHLHLGHAGTRELLYLKQYADHVVLLEIADHLHVETQPPGEVLQRLHGTAVNRWETEQDRAAQTAQDAAKQQAAAKNADIRARLGLSKKTETQFPAMRDLMKIVESVFAEHIEQVFYHVTPARNLRNIMQIGLIPKRGVRARAGKEPVGAIYLFPDRESAEQGVMNWLGDFFGEDTQLALLAVKLPPDAQIIHTKHEWEKGVVSVIPPENITVVTKDF